jgi:hypothetical protein
MFAESMDGMDGAGGLTVRLWLRLLLRLDLTLSNINLKATLGPASSNTSTLRHFQAPFSRARYIHRDRLI